LSFGSRSFRRDRHTVRIPEVKDPRPKVKDLLQMTKLLTVFDVYDDEAKALASLKGSPK
jgi:hypothetical protein